jgi:hypothetical protein
MYAAGEVDRDFSLAFRAFFFVADFVLLSLFGMSLKFSNTFTVSLQVYQFYVFNAVYNDSGTQIDLMLPAP